MWDLIKIIVGIGIIICLFRMCEYMDHPEKAGQDAARYGKAYHDAKKAFQDTQE